MKLSVQRALAVALALTYHVEARNAPLNARGPAPIVDEIDSSPDGGAAQGDTVTKLVWVRNEPSPSHFSSGTSKSSTQTRRPSGPSGGPPGGPSGGPSGGPPSDRPSATSSTRAEETETPTPSGHSQNPPPPGQTSSRNQGPSSGPVRPPPSSKNSESSSQQPPPSSPGPSGSNGSNPPSTKTPGPSESQGPTGSPSPTDSSNVSSGMTITSGAHSSTGAPVPPQTTVQVTDGDDTSTVIFTGTSVTTSEGSEPTFAWGCSQDVSDICGVVPIPGGTGGCVVPLLCPGLDNWGFGGGWVPAGNPPPGGPNPPPVAPDEPGNDDDNDDDDNDDDSTSTDPTSSDTSTSNQETSTTPTSVSTTKTSTSSTATSTSKSKERLCLTVHEGTGTVEPTQTATPTSQTGTSSTGSSTSSRATTTSASKVRMCLSVHTGSAVPESTQTATPTSKSNTSSTKSSTSSASTTSAAKERLCLSVHEGSGSATSSPATSTGATTTSTQAPSTRDHSSLPAPTSTPSTFSTATKTSEHSLCHPSSNPRGPSSCMCTSGSTQIYVPTLTGSDMCGYTKLPDPTPTEQTTENTPTMTMPTPFVTTDSDHYVTSCDSATPSTLKAAGQTFTHPACAGNKYQSPQNGIFMAMFSPSGFGTLQWRSFFIGHNDQGEWDTPKFCDSQSLSSDDSSNEYKVADPPFPEGTFTIGDNMPDGNPQDCEYSGTKDEAGTLKCGEREFECKEWRLKDGTEVCYGVYASMYGPKVLCKFPDENGKLVKA